MTYSMHDLLDRLGSAEVVDQQEAACQLGHLARRLAHDPDRLPQLAAAVGPLVRLLDSDDGWTMAAWALGCFCKSSPALAAAVGGSGAPAAVAKLLRAAISGAAHGTAIHAVLAAPNQPEGCQAAKEAGAGEELGTSFKGHTRELDLRAICNKLLEPLLEAAAAAEEEGEEARQAQRQLAARKGAALLKELADQGADVADILHQLLVTAFERSGTDVGLLTQMLLSAVAQGLQEAAVQEGMRRMLVELDDLSVDVPSAPVLMGEVLGYLVAGGGTDLAVVAEHIRTADPHPEEFSQGEDTMLVGGGGAAKLIGALLRRLAAEKGEAAAREAWKATGQRLGSFLPEAVRADQEDVTRLIKQSGLGFLLEGAQLLALE